MEDYLERRKNKLIEVAKWLDLDPDKLMWDEQGQLKRKDSNYIIAGVKPIPEPGYLKQYLNPGYQTRFDVG